MCSVAGAALEAARSFQTVEGFGWQTANEASANGQHERTNFFGMRVCVQLVEEVVWSVPCVVSHQDCPTYRRSAASARRRPKADRQARQLQRLYGRRAGARRHSENDPGFVRRPNIANGFQVHDSTRACI